MKFGVREICDVVLKTKTNRKIGNKIFYAGEPVIYFDSLKTTQLEGSSEIVYATGGRGNTNLVSWSGEKTVTFTMEDALISPVSFMILSGAGLVEGSKQNPIYVHKIEQTDKVKVGEGPGKVKITLSKEPHFDANDDSIYVMLLDNDGEPVSEPYIPKSVEGAVITLEDTDNVDAASATAWSQGFASGQAVLVDYYYKEENVQQINIMPEEFGGNFYLEAEPLFRDKNGNDMPAIFTIPNCRVQSNFSFSMSSTGDPSTFSFVMDAFPDYTRFDKTKKVLVSIDIISNSTSADILTRPKTQSDDKWDEDNQLVTRDE